MASINKVFIIGNLGQDPEQRFLPSGEAVTSINVATSEKWKDKSGEMQERTEWIRCVMFGKLAEIAAEYLRKGKQVYVEGKLRTKKWQDNDGATRYSTEVIASEMQMLGNKPQGEEPPKKVAEKPAPQKPRTMSDRSGIDELDQDIPF